MSRDSRKRKPVLRNALTRREKEEFFHAALVDLSLFRDAILTIPWKEAR